MTNFKKELRTLAWPAVAVVAATVLPLAWLALAGDSRGMRGTPIQLALVAFVLGTAILVALPFGTEFQQRTLMLALSQPVSRARIWFEKSGALLAVLFVIGVLQFAGLQRFVLDGDAGMVRGATFVLVLACSGFLWTLIAGSTIGGAVFSLAGLAMIELTTAFIASRFTGLELDPFDSHPALISVRLAYAALTAWIGWRMFARYEVRAQGEGATTLPAGMLDALPIMRARPTGAIANLVRKEVRLQQPTFLIAALFTAVWLAAMLFFAVPPERPQVADVVFVVLFISYVPLSLIVAATISIGEETSLGTRSWHLTLPLSSLTQWGVKMGATIVAAGALSVGLPLLLVWLAPAFVPLPAETIQLPSARVLLFIAAWIVLIGFWAVSLVGHTVKAAVTTGVVLGVLGVAVAAGGWIGWQSGLATDLLQWAMVRLQLPPDALHPHPRSLRHIDSVAWVAVLAVLAPVALRQSLAAFRVVQPGRRALVRGGATLAMGAMLLGLLPAIYTKSVAGLYERGPVRELQTALERLGGSRGFPASAPTRLEVSDLERTGALSDTTRRWLRGSHIEVSIASRRDGKAPTLGLTVVRFPNGREYRSLFRFEPAS